MQPAVGLPEDEGGSQRNPTPLVCVMCLKDGLPEPVAEIQANEVVYATEDGEPVCESCGFLHNLKAMRCAVPR